MREEKKSPEAFTLGETREAVRKSILEGKRHLWDTVWELRTSITGQWFETWTAKYHQKAKKKLLCIQCSKVDKDLCHRIEKNQQSL